MTEAGSGASSMLACLPQDLASRLFSGAIPQRLGPGKPLFFAGDAGDGCYRLESGLLKVTLTSPDGEELVLAFLGPGAMVGELAVIDGLPRSANAIAVKDCELSFIGRPTFDECMSATPELYRCLVEALATRLRGTDEALAAVSFLSLKGRVARALLELAALLGESSGNGQIVIRQPIRQRDLAAMVGIARENVSRILSDWKRRDLVSCKSEYYAIVDPAALRREMER